MTIIEEPTEYNKQQYEQAVPIPAKFLQMDGTITSHLGKTQEEATMKCKLYAWKLGIMSTTIGYLENENTGNYPRKEIFEKNIFCNVCLLCVPCVCAE